MDLRQETRRLLALALPLMVAQGGLMTMGLVDTFMIGRVSSLDMGAVALGNGIFGVVIVFGVGLAMGIEPLVSQAFGANEKDQTGHWLWQGLWVSALVSLPLMILTMLGTLAFEPFGVPEEIAGCTTLYLWSRVPGVAFNCIYSSFRAYLSSLGRTGPIVSAVVTANVVNILLDAFLLFVLDFGAVGIGLATSACWVVMMVIAAYPVLRSPGARLVPPVLEDMKRVFRFGLPVGFQLCIEVGVFALVSMLIARLGEVALAAHQVALSLASATFMCAVGIAVASSARVGFHVGAENTTDARRSGFLGIVIGGVFMGATGLAFFFLADPLAALFSPKDPEVAVLGATLLRIAAFFSVFDGVQVVSAGALRGAGETRWPFLANAFGHWLIGLPCGLLLLAHTDLGAKGYWWGLTVGLFLVSVILVARFTVLSSQPILRADRKQNVMVEHETGNRTP